ncbi:sialoadhesin-like [Saccostrea echinata]|uniref:sialoadhesin-like n=1 Tax=Saccostrea echinata TaxID=191078 RepID=UPI002A82B41E|nr:sialoadhesin-like [Saccostrea echinata]
MEPPTQDSEADISSFENSESTSIKREYGPKNVILHYKSDREDLWEGKENLTLTCRADCNPPCDKYIIYHNGQILYYTNDRVHFTKDRKNSGKYRCAAYDVKSEEFVNSTDVDIDIKYGPTNVSIHYTSNREDLWEGKENVTLTCRADCNPRCDKYRIYYNGQVLSNTRMTYIEKDRKNSGNYSCAAYDVKSGGYVSSAEVDIDIKYREVYLLSKVKEMSLRVNKFLPSNVVCTIKCNFKCDSDIEVTKNSTQYTTIKSNESIFSDRKAISSDSGVYRCTSGNSQSAYDFKLNILYGPSNVSVTKSGKKVKSEIVLTERSSELYWLTCWSECNPRCNVTWYKNGKLLNDEKHQIMVISINRNQSGTYRCEADGIEGKRSSDEVKIIVYYPPQTVEVKPSNDTFYSRRNGTPITDITCKADCLPQCSYVWYELKRTWNYFNYRAFFFTRGTTLFAYRNFTKNDSRFQCAASNSIGTKHSTWIVVEVKNGPADVRIYAIGLTRENHPFKLRCSADCYHGCLSYTWFYKNEEIHNGQYLNFNNPSRENNGEYTCKVNDYFGTASNKHGLNLQYKPRLSRFGIIHKYIIAPGSVYLNFSIDSFPPSNVEVVHRGKILKYDTNVTGSKSYQIEVTSCLDEGDYIVNAKNDAGSADYLNRVTVKCSPMILTYSNVSNKGFKIGDPMNLMTTFIANPAADVSWSFTSYKSRNVSQKVEKNLIHNEEKVTSIIVDKLHVDNFGIYQLTLVNDIGNKTISFSIRGPPHSPTELSLDCLSTAFLEWKPGFDGGMDQSFLVEYTTNISSPWLPQPLLSITSKDNDRLSTYVTLMNPNARYFFRVVSENVFGKVISNTIVNCTVQAVGNENSFISHQAIAGISGGTILLLMAIIVLVLFGVNRYKIHNRKGHKARTQNAAQEEDCGMGMIENTLYISGDNLKATTISSSDHPQNNTVNTESGNDVYSVVKKTEKIEPDIPVYAEVCKSRPVKNKPAIKKKPSKKTKNIKGKTVNKDGLVYADIDLKGTTSNGKSVIHGSDNKTLYVDIDFNQHADPLPECDVEDTKCTNQNEKKSQLE